MRDLFFFDAAARVGTPQNGGLVYAATPADLLAEMDRNGVDRALVRDVNCPNAGAVYGNDRVARHVAEGAGRLDGVWTILPEQTREVPAGGELFAAMRRHGVRALDLSPVEHRWVASRLAIGKTLNEAAERRVPILLSQQALGSWEAVYAFVQAHPENRFVFLTTGQYWGLDRQLRPLLENIAGFHVEISTYWVPDGLAALARLYGADRLLYGSGFPDFNHANMMLALRRAELPDDEIRAIAGHNLARLLDEAEL